MVKFGKCICVVCEVFVGKFDVFVEEVVVLVKGNVIVKFDEIVEIVV